MARASFAGLRQKLGIHVPSFYLKSVILGGLVLTIVTMTRLHATPLDGFEPSSSLMASPILEARPSNSTVVSGLRLGTTMQAVAVSNEAKSERIPKSVVIVRSLETRQGNNVIDIPAITENLVREAKLPGGPAHEDVPTSRVRLGLFGSIVHGGWDMSVQMIQQKRDLIESSMSTESFNWRSIIYAAFWGLFLQAFAFPLWFWALSNFPVVEADFRLLVEVALCTGVVVPALLVNCFIAELERGWLLGRTPLSALASRVRGEVAHLPVFHTLWFLLWPCWFLVGFVWMPPWLRGPTTSAVAALWYISVCLLGIDLRPKVRPASKRDKAVAEVEALRARTPLPSDFVLPDFGAEEIRNEAVAAIFKDLNPEDQALVRPVKIDSKGAVVRPDAAQVLQAKVISVEPLVSGGSPNNDLPELPPSLSPDEVSQACEEMMLRTIRENAPPIIQQFLESNLGLLGPSARQMPVTAQVPAQVVGAQIEEVSELGQDTRLQEDDDEIPEMPIVHGSLGAIATLMAKR